MVLIVALDPSGNHSEGNGTTGICELEGKEAMVKDIHAGSYEMAEAYWGAHIDYLDSFLLYAKKNQQTMEVVMEGYRLYGHKSATQINSTLETPQLIGVIKFWCYENCVPLKIQFAADVKNRWSDSVLEKLGVIEIVNRRRKLSSSGQWLNNHKTDALRHALHYQKYGRKKG